MPLEFGGFRRAVVPRGDDSPARGAIGPSSHRHPVVFSRGVPRSLLVPFRKTAIAMPESLLADVDRAAQARGESRSAYITRVLRAAVRARRDAEITKRLDELFADERTAKTQRPGPAAPE